MSPRSIRPPHPAPLRRRSVPPGTATAPKAGTAHSIWAARSARSTPTSRGCAPSFSRRRSRRGGASRRPSAREAAAQQAAGSPEEIDELRRHNHQLEEQNLELRHRIEELTSDHEDRAATLEISDSLEQFKTFLGLKLKEDYADYNAISREALNEVVRRHAHEILGRIFAVLEAEGSALTARPDRRRASRSTP